MALLFALEIGLVTEFYFYLIVKFNKDHMLNLGMRTQTLIWIVSLAAGCGVSCFLERWGLFGQLACGTLAAYLLTASITDWQTYEVYDFLAIFTAIIGFGFLLFQNRQDWIVSVLLFLVIQITLFMRMYGRADGYAFLVCALFESQFGAGLLTYLLHMGAAFLLLGMVQGLRGNINSKGNLRHSVAFLPYISVTVWWFL